MEGPRSCLQWKLFTPPHPHSLSLPPSPLPPHSSLFSLGSLQFTSCLKDLCSSTLHNLGSRGFYIKLCKRGSQVGIPVGIKWSRPRWLSAALACHWLQRPNFLGNSLLGAGAYLQLPLQCLSSASSHLPLRSHDRQPVWCCG